MTRLYALIDGQVPATLVELKATPDGHLLTSSAGQSNSEPAGSTMVSSALKFSKSEIVGDTTYVLKTSPTAWLMVKLVSTSTAEEAFYASAGNNSFTTTDTAWAERATLIYGTH